MSKVLLGFALSMLAFCVPIAAMGEHKNAARQSSNTSSIVKVVDSLASLTSEELLILHLLLLQESELLIDSGASNYGLTTGSCPGTSYCEKTVCDFRGPDGVCEYSHTERYCCSVRWNLEYHPVMRD